jgi:hypothetical protein
MPLRVDRSVPQRIPPKPSGSFWNAGEETGRKMREIMSMKGKTTDIFLPIFEGSRVKRVQGFKRNVKCQSAFG